MGFGVPMSKFEKKDPRDYMVAKEQYGLSHKQFMFGILYVGECECVGWKAASRSYGKADGITTEGGSMDQNTAKSIAIQNLKKPNMVAFIQDLMGLSLIHISEPTRLLSIS